MDGGDMYEGHCGFLYDSARYDTDGSPCMSSHAQWANLLPCKVLRLNGDDDLNKNSKIIVHEYLKHDFQG